MGDYFLLTFDSLAIITMLSCLLTIIGIFPACCVGKWVNIQFALDIITLAILLCTVYNE